MIISTFYGETRTANVCQSLGGWGVMCYENEEYIKSLTALNQNAAEVIAEDWIRNDSV